MDLLAFMVSTCFVVYRIKTLPPLMSSNNLETSLRQSLQDGTSRDAQERVCTVTKDNVPTPEGNLRSEMRLKNLWHRATYILVRHSGEDSDDDKILVQRRSMLKDYCPGKLDPTPGGVVGFGESYEENATREIEEEMGIDLSEENPYRNRMNRLFQFSFEDDRVKVWGEFWEATYNGPIEKLTLQTEEVAEILSIPVKELQALLEKSPDKFLPDSRHAIQLYFERSAGERQ